MPNFRARCRNAPYSPHTLLDAISAIHWPRKASHATPLGPGISGSGLHPRLAVAKARKCMSDCFALGTPLEVLSWGTNTWLGFVINPTVMMAKELSWHACKKGKSLLPRKSNRPWVTSNGPLYTLSYDEGVPPWKVARRRANHQRCYTPLSSTSLILVALSEPPWVSGISKFTIIWII